MRFVRLLSAICQAYGFEIRAVRHLSCVCQANCLTDSESAHILCYRLIRGVTVVLEKITEAGQKTKGFSELPITAQVSVLYLEIEDARKLSIPLSAICDAMNAAGSTVTLRYLREALSIVRRRMKAKGMQPGSGQIISSTPREPEQQIEPKTPKPAPIPVQSTKTQTPKEARDKKAEAYTNSASNNPLLRQLNKQKD